MYGPTHGIIELRRFIHVFDARTDEKNKSRRARRRFNHSIRAETDSEPKPMKNGVEAWADPRRGGRGSISTSK